MSKSSKHCKRRLTVFGTISLIVIILFVYNLISYISLVNQLEKQQSEQETKLNQLKNEYSVLKDEIEKLKNSDYLAKYAREKFLYSKQDEYIIRIDEIEKQMVETNNDKVESSRIVIIISICLTLFILFIYVYIKTRKRSLE